MRARRESAQPISGRCVCWHDSTAKREGDTRSLHSHCIPVAAPVVLSQPATPVVTRSHSLIPLHPLHLPRSSLPLTHPPWRLTRARPITLTPWRLAHPPWRLTLPPGDSLTSSSAIDDCQHISAPLSKSDRRRNPLIRHRDISTVFTWTSHQHPISTPCASPRLPAHNPHTPL